MQRFFYTLLFFFLLLHTQLNGQVSQVEFGKNRIQYHQDYDEWSQYESRNFITYWYGEGRYIGQSVVQIAEYDFFEIESILEHRINDKIEIIVYTDLSDLKQSNIGSEEAFMNTSGQTKIVGNKIFIYFNGDHTHLRKQIREGIASVFLNAMLFGANLQEIVQNAVMLNLPIWFKDGLISFVGRQWDAELDNELRDAFLSGEFENFEELADEKPYLAGHSLWYFIDLHFGKSTVSNLLYLTRINRSVENGFMYVLGSSYEKTLRSWYSYFQQRYKGETAYMNAPQGTLIPIKNKRQLPLTQVKISPDGQKIAYVFNEIGRTKVYIQDLQTNKRDVVFKSGFRNPFQATDYNYPLLAWSPSGFELAIMYERRDVIKLLKYDLNTKKSEVEDMSTQYQRIYSMDYITNFDLVLSGTVRGHSDIFLYFTKTRQTQRITNDFWDDLDARYVQTDNQRGIIFASNRQDSILQSEKLDSILPVGHFDLFYFDLSTRSNELIRLTNTPYADESVPMHIDTTYFSYLSNANGIRNRHMGYLEEYIHHYDKIVAFQDGSQIIMHPDSALTTKLDSIAIAQIDTVEIVPFLKKRSITFPVTNYDRSIEYQHHTHRADRMVEQIIRDGEQKLLLYQVYSDSLAQPVRQRNTLFKEKQLAYLERIRLSKPLTSKKEEKVQEPILQEKEEKPIDQTQLPTIKKEPDTNKVDIDNYLFQSEFDETETPPQVVVEEDEGQVTIERPKPQPKDKQPVQPLREEDLRNHKFRSSKIIPYRLKFRMDYVTTTLDNSPLFDGLNTFSGTPQESIYPPPGILLKANFKDLFEDYELEGGVRVPTTFNGTEYFLFFDDKKKRLDKRYAVYRRAQRFSEEVIISSPLRPKREVVTMLGQVQLRYPFDIFRSVRAIGTLRFDNTNQLATDRNTLSVPAIREQRLGIRGEYIFDNTLDFDINLKHGTRYKVYAEAVKRFNLNLSDGVSLGFNEGFMGILGVDARHYQRFLKYSVLAGRFAASTSFGSEKILYFLGGTDNWIFPRYNQETPTPTDGNFAFIMPAPNMRGFRLNIRNGNSYALINSEVRIPIFRYFSRRLRSNFLRNFQLVGFFDMGTAWQGLNPFDDDNPLNTKTLPDPPVPSNPVEVKIKFFRDPVVLGYGGGVRALLFGYFVRVDYSWGLETREIQDPRLFISLGMDF